MSQFTNLLQVTEYFSDKQTCIDYLTHIRWGGHVRCAFCEHDRVYELKGTYKRFKCAKCRKQFSAIKGTIFENSPVPLQKWFVAVYILTAHKKGISSLQLASDIGVTQKTAWFMAQRIRYALKVSSFEKKEGVYQVDETYFGEKNKNRHADKKIKNSQGRSLKAKAPVVGIVDLNGELHVRAVKDTKAETLMSLINEVALPGSIIITDDYLGYSPMPKHFHHVVLEHKLEEYARGAFSTNRLEGFWSIMKRGVTGIYHRVSAKHLHRYCNEFSFRYRRRRLTNENRFDESLRGSFCRLTYAELTAKSGNIGSEKEAQPQA